MKTLIIIAISLPALFVTISLKAGNDPFKIYQVTEDGSFHFAFMEADIPNKEGIKPVTVRTFYLETMRHGLLPSDLTYEAFLELTPDEIQAMIEQNQMNLMAAMEADKAEAIRIKRNIPIIRCEPIMSSELNTESEEGVILPQEEGSEAAAPLDSLILPWIVKVIVDPTDGYRLPAFNQLPSLQVHPGKQELKTPEIILSKLAQ